MVVILHNVRSLHNVGSIFRTADAVDAEKIFLCGITPTPLDRFGNAREPLAKVSLGAEKSVSWERARSASKIIKKLKKAGYKIFAIEQNKKSVSYNKLKTKNSIHSTSSGLMLGKVEASKLKIALLLGNEVRGLPPAVLKQADKILEIPMRGAMVRQARHPRRINRGKESLNVAVAFGIVAYHLKFC